MSTAQERTWNPEIVAGLLSCERMDTYLRAVSGDLDAAFVLYRKNMQIAGKLQMATAMVEVVARNAMDSALVEWNEQTNPGADWFDSSLLDSRAKNAIITARSRARVSKPNPGHGDVLAEISFGFWRYLASKRHLITLWIPALQYAFPYGHINVGTRQKQVTKLIGRMVFIRNRAAHLEPVFSRDLQQDISQARLLLSWVCPDAAAWFDDTLNAGSLTSLLLLG